MKNTRRSFVKAASAAFAVPFILPAYIWSAETPPSERLTMGFIGMGKQNKGLLNNFLQQDTQVLAVCDVDKNRLTAAKARVEEFYKSKPEKAGAPCMATKDFMEIIGRKDIDAVCIATPDHWHAYPTIAALDAGKDVYCEKPLTHNVHEAVEVIAAVERNKAVLQTGSMQRSMKEFHTACELVRNGHIGEIERVEVSFGDPGRPCDLNEEDMEPGLDWDRWVGPAAMRPYNSVLSPRGVHNHFPNWRAYKEFGGGMVTDWGAHHIDIAQWGLGMDRSGPVEINPPEKKGDKRGAELVYANGVTVTHVSGPGVMFYGTDGEVFVHRGKFSIKQGDEMKYQFTKREDGGSLEGAVYQARKQILGDNIEYPLYKSQQHIQDFLQAVKARTKPITNEIVGGRTAIACHLMNQAYYNHDTIRWNPKRMAFVKGTGDAAWLTRDYRAPWKV